ncbi:MAG: phage major capsid protein [Thermoproteota archaeon]|nr:MAG: phage major capsid protein [Candidatus Korarchaeota archaeon]
MASPNWTQTVDTIFTTTWAYRKTTATQQAFLKTPFIYWLREKGRVENISGHRRIEIPVEYGDNETVRWIQKGDTVPITDSELVTMAYDSWKYVSVSVMRWLQDEQQNRGKAAMINLAKLKLGAAERALYEEFERVMFSDGSGDKEPNGLKNLVSTSPTSGTVHGLDRSTYTWWRNQTKTASGAASLYLVSDMRTCLNNIIKYSKAEVKDIVMVTTQDIFELYEEEGYELYQLHDNTLFDAGFDTLQFRRRPIMWCPSAPSGNMYFLNTAYLKLVCDEGYWMEMTDWKQIPNQPFDRTAQIVCAMNLTCSRPIVQLVLSGISA